MLLSTRTKVLLLVSALLMLFLGAAGLLLKSQQDQWMQIETITQEERRAATQRILNLSAQSTRAFCDTETYWDEFVVYIKKPEEKWVKINLVPAMETEKLHQMWILNRQGKLLFSYGRGYKDRPIEEVFSVPSVVQALDNKKQIHFFSFVGNQVLEIHGATIHPSSDALRKGKYYGYFLVGRYWEPTILKGLSEMARVKISVATHKATAQNTHDQKKMRFYLPLSDITGQVVAQLRCEGPNAAVATAQQLANTLLIAFGVFAVVTLSLVLLCLEAWFRKPLQAITEALQNEVPCAPDAVRSGGQELHTLAQLVETFFVQKTDLVRIQQDLEQRVAARTEDLTLANGALTRAEERLREVLANTPVVVFALDNMGIVQFFSGKGLIGARLTAETAVGKSAFRIFRGDPLTQERLRSVLAGGEAKWEMQVRHQWYEIQCRPHYDHDGNRSGLIGVAIDITERKKFEEQLERQAFYDSLTGLPNRLLFHQALERALGRARRNATCMAVLYIDIDNFKNVNDSVGHTAGDQLLRQISQRLRLCARESDIISRLGGDEFAILIEDLEMPDDAIALAERVTAVLGERFVIDSTTFYCGASVGITYGTFENETVSTILRSADIAMYQAKNNGKGRFILFDNNMENMAQERIQIETDLHYAMERDELDVHFQPIVSIQTGEIHAIEALVRWHHKKRGDISPAKFVPIAEESGLIVALDRWVLRHACEQYLRWFPCENVSCSPRLSVNLSARLLLVENAAATITNILCEVQMPFDCLQLEVTETAMLHDAVRAAATLRELHEKGIHIAIDDFGTGYSSMAYLSTLPIDALKIDRSFVQEMKTRPEVETIVRTMVNLAKSLKLSITCEGVETQEQQKVLTQMGCDWAQGYYFARPMTPEQIEELLASLRKPAPLAIAA